MKKENIFGSLSGKNKVIMFCMLPGSYVLPCRMSSCIQEIKDQERDIKLIREKGITTLRIFQY